MMKFTILVILLLTIQLFSAYTVKNNNKVKHLISLKSLLGTQHKLKLASLSQILKSQSEVKTKKFRLASINELLGLSDAPVDGDVQDKINTLMTPQEIMYKLYTLDQTKDEILERQAQAYVRYRKYRRGIRQLGSVDNDNEKETYIIDRGLERQMKVITWVSLSFIDALNLEEKLDLFHFMNFKYLDPSAMTPELQNTKNILDSLYQGMATIKQQQADFRQVLDNDNNLLWEAKNRILWRDRDGLYNATASNAYENAKQTFLRESLSGAEHVASFKIAKVGTWAQEAERERQNFLNGKMNKFLENFNKQPKTYLEYKNTAYATNPPTHETYYRSPDLKAPNQREEEDDEDLNDAITRKEQEFVDEQLAKVNGEESKYDDEDEYDDEDDEDEEEEEPKRRSSLRRRRHHRRH